MRKRKDKSENVNVLSLTIPSIESLVFTIQKLQHDIIAPIDVEKLTNLPKYKIRAQRPYLKTDGNISAPPPRDLLSYREVKIHPEIEHDNVTLGRLRER